ncbi:hypothetical protein B7P43_G02313 [Cryptotermes secundus]|uniref:Uncharacterized protein n=1 Tax=Cryptotermes secundus TaxID=105785 RepID=A0A2J7RCT1_9NEOP|nr:hypothetical protein B7P43_G02313 [Cryptotermes secundus]
MKYFVSQHRERFFTVLIPQMHAVASSSLAGVRTVNGRSELTCVVGVSRRRCFQHGNKLASG